jgi:Berberine and berberine like
VHSLEFHAQWAPDDAPGPHIAWARAARPAARSASAGGGYVNFIRAEDPGRVGAAYGGNYGRLARVKAVYDPENFFHFNNNIPPWVPAGDGDQEGRPSVPPGNADGDHG